MGKGFILCAVICASLALAVYAGLYQFIGISDGAAIFLLLGICLVFHGAAIYMLNPQTKSESQFEASTAQDQADSPAMTSKKKESQISTRSSPGGDGVLSPGSRSLERLERVIQAGGRKD